MAKLKRAMARSYGRPKSTVHPGQQIGRPPRGDLSAAAGRRAAALRRLRDRRRRRRPGRLGDLPGPAEQRVVPGTPVDRGLVLIRLDRCVVHDEPLEAQDDPSVSIQRSSGQLGSTAAHHRGASRGGAVSVPGIWAWPRFAVMGRGNSRRHSDHRAYGVAKAIVADRAVQNATPPDVLTGPNH